MDNVEGSPQQQLQSLGLCDEGSIEIIHPRVRDRDDIQVLRCDRSGVIFLSSYRHVSAENWTERQDFDYWSAGTRETVLAGAREDDVRRARQFGPMLAGKRWLDVGTGVGGVLESMQGWASSVTAVEPQAGPRKALVEAGYRVVPSMEDLAGDEFDVVTLFHVFEHLVDPLSSLRRIRSLLSTGGQVVIEVPHARDMLLSFLQLEAFKDFTFWSEHLILHTRESLRAFLEAAGFTDVVVKGVQRYPLANHLHWLREGKPGGHIAWHQLRSDALDKEYEATLARLDLTDTLVATAGL